MSDRGVTKAHLLENVESSFLSITEIFEPIGASIWSGWQPLWDLQISNDLRILNPTIKKWPSLGLQRKYDVIITRFRIGHCRLTTTCPEMFSSPNTTDSEAYISGVSITHPQDDRSSAEGTE